MSWLARMKRELGRETQPVDLVVRLIILERSIRGGLLALLGLALLTDSRQVLTLVRHYVAELNLNPGRNLFRRAIVAVLRQIGLLPPRTVVIIALAALAFAALEITEAVGLARRRRWAEYLTVIATAFGIPFELREVLAKQTPVRISFLLINVAVVIYLARKKRLFVGEDERPAAPSPSGWRPGPAGSRSQPPPGAEHGASAGQPESRARDQPKDPG